MKTSNYILTAFFTFLFGGVLVLFVAARLHQMDNNGGLWLSKEKKLEPFSVIVAEPGANFQLRTAEYPHIITAYELPDSCKFPPFDIKNDTLFVHADLISDKHRNPDIIYCKDIKSIVARKNTNLILQDFQIAPSDTITVKLSNAKINMFGQYTKNTDGAYFFEAQESEVNIGGVNLKLLDVDIDNSKINSWNSSIEKLSGTLINHSEMSAPAAMGKISLEVDSTSHFNFY